MATSMQALSSRGLLPKRSSTVCTETPASAATARTVVAAYPWRSKSPVAAASTRPRVRDALAARWSER